MLSEDFIVIGPDDHEHGVAEVIEVPGHHFLAVVLLQHHGVVHLARVVYFLELFRWLDVKRLNNYFVAATVWLMVGVASLLALLLVAHHVLHALVGATTSVSLRCEALVWQHVRSTCVDLARAQTVAKAVR